MRFFQFNDNLGEEDVEMEEVKEDTPEILLSKKIGKIFTGMNMIINRAQNEEEKDYQTKTHDTEFKQFILNPQFKDLYSAWEENLHSEIDDYKENDKIIPLVSETWIKELPKVLNFIISRVSYNNQGQLTKNNSKFDFDEVIYPDCFLLENADISRKKRDEVKEMRDRVHQLQEHIDKFTNYSNGQDIRQVLDSAAKFLTENNESQGNSAEENKTNLFSPENLSKSIGEKKNLNEYILYFCALKEKAEEQVKKMELELKELQEKIQNSYKSFGNTPYYLHTIMIHDGGPESGHYFTYIKDFSSQKFRKYNDRTIDDVEDENVWENSKGSTGKCMNAYCLVYVNQEIHDSLENPELKKHHLQNFGGPEQDSDYYNSLVGPKLELEIIQKNQDLAQKVEEDKAEDKAREIMALYEERYKKIEEFVKKDDVLRFPFASNICIFFMRKPNSTDNNAHLGRWFLLNL